MNAARDLIVSADAGTPSLGSATLGELRWRCALGRSGIRHEKREGDGATPAGRFALRRLLYRPDRLAPPTCILPTAALTPSDGWCDDPAEIAYNRAVALPYPASCENLWRNDTVYDLILVVGHNDGPPSAGAGSAIFVHCGRPDYAPTAGCIAFAPADLQTLLGLLASDSIVEIRP